MKMQTIQAIKGMADVLPEQSALWERLELVVTDTFRQYGYRNMRTPIPEPTSLFVRGIGDATDIVEKEMYRFIDGMNGDAITLRPEATAGLVRASIEHNLTYGAPQRVWTVGPMYRHEKPQKGRLRQFHQFDVECFGYAGPDVDAEIIIMLARIWKVLGISRATTLQINSIGDPEERRAHREKLLAYFETHKALLDEDSLRRLEKNPLRILDSKNPNMQAMLSAAPTLLDSLGEASKTHFETFCQLLTDACVSYTINPRIVRGMDYYNRTVFEWVTDKLGSQGTICGGGRYDGLFEQLGGKPTPSIGFGLGVERTLLLMEACEITAEHPLDAYVVHSNSRAAMPLAEHLRDQGLSVTLHAGGGKFAAQMKRADASGATYAVILGDDEVAQQTVTLKHLATGEQRTISQEELIANGFAQ
jgi:histidyl-tRNA synthetase